MKDGVAGMNNRLHEDKVMTIGTVIEETKTMVIP